MRCGVATVLAVGLGFGLVSSASAADYGPLRGSTFDPPRYRNWEGFYVGGQVGTGGGGADFSGEGSALINRLTDHLFWQSSDISSWLTAGKADTGQELQYGAFIGYNMQWGDVVLGVDASYNHTDLSAVAQGRTPTSGYIQVQDGNGWIWPTAVSGESRITLTDFGTIRGRAGWAVGSFLPYVTGGLALGRASYGSTATVAWSSARDGTGTNPAPNPGSMSTSDGKSNALIYGWSAGIGMDVALTQNIFLRGEYEFIQFSQSKLNLNNARAGLGIKF
ncbi:outer membrane beta-barrel protein [Xanthobacteraceae bacterium Astr-EGSB]|uniref:outer membrane protein n=1 Tax=Astrobacterium formosum TaxID=3069710 RepID=UPI0027AFE3D2|nr:outer membrane beta-barrel protein [Xanthobacteraceae bacterium Astr-EGSB]